MDAVNLAQKLSYAGARSPVPFITGPEYINSVPGVPVCSEIRLFVPREYWSHANVQVAAREICRILGASAAFDVGLVTAGRTVFDPNLHASGETARLAKLEASSPIVTLEFGGIDPHVLLEARFPGLKFEPVARSAVEAPAPEAVPRDVRA